MTLYLVRHGKAGSRSNHRGPDNDRPLTRSGRKQALAIAATLARAGIERVVSSPSVRCVQTVEPLAWVLGAEIETSPDLVEGAPLEDALTVVKGVSVELSVSVVLCTHGDVLGDLLDAFTSRPEIDLDGPLQLAKGCIWEIEANAGTVTAARYRPPTDE